MWVFFFEDDAIEADEDIQQLDSLFDERPCERSALAESGNFPSCAQSQPHLPLLESS